MAANSGCRVGSPPMTLIMRQTFPRRRDSSTKRSIWLNSMRSALGACRQLRLQLRHFRLHSYVMSISIISRHDRYCGPSNAVAARVMRAWRQSRLSPYTAWPTGVSHPA